MLKSTNVLKAKLNVNLNLFAPDLQTAVDMICKAILGHQPDNDVKAGEKYIWALRRTGTMNVNGEKVVYGKLGKASEKDIPVLTESDFELKQLENYAKAWSSFVFIPSVEHFIFEDKSSDISPSSFCLKMAEIIEKNEPLLNGKLTINVLEAEGEFLKFLLSAKKVKRVQFNISPRNGDLVNWNAIEDEIERTRATTLRKTYISQDESGLEIRNTEVEEYCGYVNKGWASAVGIAVSLDDQILTRATKSGHQKFHVEYEDDDKSWVMEFVRQTKER